jgi:allantoinase
VQVTKDALRFKNKLSAYEGRTLQGVVHATYVRGRLVFERERADGGFEGLSPLGELL